MEKLKYNYTTEIKTYPNTNQKFMAINMGEENNSLSGFLNVEITGELTANYYLEAMEKVLKRESEFEAVHGDIFGLEIKQDKTDIMNVILEKSKVNSIETIELRKLILAVVKEREKFEQQQKKQPDTGRDFF